MPISTRSLCAHVFLALVLAAVAPAVSAADADLDEILTRFDEVQNSMRTLSAEFTETTESPLLTDTISAQGRLYLTKPDRVRWEYSAPEEMRFVISQDIYTGYFPKQKRAEKRDVHRWREHLFRFLGIGQASAELSKFYNIRLGEPEPDGETVLLLFDPRKKRVRKRMESVKFWISATTFLPVKVEYRSKNGNLRVIEFEQMSMNPELAAGLYTVDLPADVTVTKGFSALSGFSASGH